MSSLAQESETGWHIALIVVLKLCFAFKRTLDLEMNRNHIPRQELKVKRLLGINLITLSMDLKCRDPACPLEESLLHCRLVFVGFFWIQATIKHPPS